MDPKDKERMWAYLDGEMEPREAARYEETLDAAALSRLEGERRLEAGASSKLRQGPACPDDVWRRLESGLRRRQEGRQGHGAFLRRAAPLLAAAVVLIAIGAGVYAFRAGQPSPAFLTAYDSVAQLRQLAEISGDEGAVEAYANEHGYRLVLKPPPGASVTGHDTRLVGARAKPYRGGEVLELLYDCCGQPMAILVAEEGSKAGRTLAAAKDARQVRAFRRQGGYALALVGDHESESLLNLVSFDARARASYL